MRKALLIVILALMVTACTELPVSPRPDPRGGNNVGPYTASAESLALRDYYMRVERNLLSQGLLRTDGGGPDAPFSKRQLVDNFIQIGVFSEFTLVDGRYINMRSAGQVQRWEDPVRIKLEFGRSVSAAQRASDTAFLADYASRLSRVTGHPIGLTRGRGNFHVAVLDQDEIAQFAPRLRQIVPGLSETAIDQVLDMSRPIYCSVYTFSSETSGKAFDTAIAIIRSEHPDRLRQLCFHEEIAQGLGLSNDSPAARPSIFNDDNEFALLTRHDELLLNMLYDERLPLGGTPEQARPVIEILAAELLGGGS